MSRDKVKAITKGLTIGASVVGHVANTIDFWNVYSYATEKRSGNSTSANNTADGEPMQGYTASFLSPIFWFIALALYDAATILTYCCITRKQKKEQENGDIEKGERTRHISKRSGATGKKGETLDATEMDETSISKSKKSTSSGDVEEDMRVKQVPGYEALARRVSHLERLVSKQHITSGTSVNYSY